MTIETNPKCALCDTAISDPVSDFECSGCGEYICEDHPNGQAFGSHDPEDHDIDPDAHEDEE